ncbi:ubiquitin E3 ligase ICP0 [Equid alphaherpesvirus 8]|uniref:E3 ubiquitin-protein ligase ICP0 n=1 Tax=Equid alphaherpesvirus 8 TaxID=39637 RepID=I1V8H7_9ALPH|nr:ORF63 gene product [Equid alphaherpesvirus 8]AFI33199.1 ubiquitin E3 ligase ICP0 [Equid alphaherpesvirus 8]
MATVAERCPICLEDPPSNYSMALPCLHAFCYVCITRWIRQNPTCPLCKVPVESVVHTIESDSEFKETKVSVEFDYDSEEDEDSFEGQFLAVDTGNTPANISAWNGPMAFVPLNANGTAGAPRLQPLVDWLCDRLDLLFETPDLALVMRNIVMDTLCEHGCNEEELTRQFWPMFHEDTAPFVTDLIIQAELCIASRQILPIASGRGVEYIDSSSSSSSGEETDSDTEVDPNNLTDPEDTSDDTSTDNSSAPALAPRQNNSRPARARPARARPGPPTRGRRRGRRPAAPEPVGRRSARLRRRQPRTNPRTHGEENGDIIDLTLDSDGGTEPANVSGSLNTTEQPVLIPDEEEVLPPSPHTSSNSAILCLVSAPTPSSAAEPPRGQPVAPSGSSAEERPARPRCSLREFARRFMALAPRDSPTGEAAGSGRWGTGPRTTEPLTAAVVSVDQSYEGAGIFGGRSTQHVRRRTEDDFARRRGNVLLRPRRQSVPLVPYPDITSTSPLIRQGGQRVRDLQRAFQTQPSEPEEMRCPHNCQRYRRNQ